MTFIWENWQISLLLIQIIFHGGPTNSGKTYQALQRLKTAQKGLYVGPLRLLAAEVYETLTSAGVYTNLLTGQDSRDVPFATHTAATVELTPLDEEFDIVVIDEIQMIADTFRGEVLLWQYCVGLPAVVEAPDIFFNKPVVGSCASLTST